jgi:tetratricopeptide (TPR) repeat protein
VNGGGATRRRVAGRIRTGTRKGLRTMAEDCRMAWTQGALAVGLACLAGCQYTGSAGRDRGSPGIVGTPTAAISSAQEADAQIALGRVAEMRGDLDEAKGAYRSALVRNAGRADAYQRLAVLADKQGKFRESAELYRQALETAPGSPEVYCDMGYSLYLQRRWAEAEMNLRQVIALNSEHQRAHNNLGLVLAHDSRTEEALAEFHKGGCGEAEARENVALAMTTEGRWDEARSQYRLALRARPDSATARARLAEIDHLVARLGATKRTAPTMDHDLLTASADRVRAPEFAKSKTGIEDLLASPQK